ncbi:MAG: peptidoglycan-binding protein [Clostridia bacterium]|nr:peptidoglycan-binding protein [Clostridia bacterium]
MSFNDRERPVGIKPFPDTGDFEMKEGDRHNLVMILQIMLDVLKLYYDDFGAASVCGVYDEATRDAVISYQKIAGIPATGVVDCATWNRLAEEFNAALYENQ